MMRLTILAGLVFYLICISPTTESKASIPFVDKRVGGVIVGEDKIEKVIALYGQGVVRKNYHGETLCYYDVQGKTYFNLSFHDGVLESIILSKTQGRGTAKECRKKNKINKVLATGKGIRLGDSLDKVVKIYGEPQKKEIREGVHIFEYHADHTEDPHINLSYDIYLHFKKNKLVKLVIHDGE